MNFTQSNFKNMDKQQSAYGVPTKQLHQIWKSTFSISGVLSKTFSTYREINHRFFCVSILSQLVYFEKAVGFLVLI